MKNARFSSRHASESGLTFVEFVIALGIVLVVALAFAYLLRDLILAKRSGVLTGTVVDGSYTTPPPATLTGPAQVVYTVLQKPYQQAAGGPVLAGGRGMPFPGVMVTFSLKTDDATVNGGAVKVVTTDANGNATITLTPVQDGSDVLNVALTTPNGGGGLEDPVPFEVDAP
jgi:hypothetical protein